MAYTDNQWETVRAFYERGLTAGEIVSRKEVAITDRGSINRRAKKEGWVAGIKAALVDNEIKALENKAAQNAPEILVHEALVDERTKHLTFFNTASLIIARAATKRVQAEPSMPMQDMRHASEIVAKQRDGTLGKAPDTAIQINNNIMTKSQVAGMSDDDLALLAYGK